MDKKRQNRIDLVFLIDFLHCKPNRWIIGISTALFIAVFLYFVSIPTIHVFPAGEDFKIVFYDDSVNGGNSEILNQHISDRSIEVEFELKKGFQSPYIGIGITLLNNSVINLSRYNQIRLKVAGKQLHGIGVSLFTKNPYGNKSVHSNDLCFFNNIEISPESKEYVLKLNQFRIPDWWTDYNHISPNEKTQPNLKNVLSMNIGTAYSPGLNTRYTLTIEKISFESNNLNLVLLLLLAELIVILLVMIIHYLRVRLRETATPITITYKPIDAENKQLDEKDFLNYINHNFHDQELSLDQVSNHTGINQRRIANSILQAYDCNFKTYVNRIRISESKRLLKNSELNMGEIAFKVGFSNQTHFNRVFKSTEGISPSEFRGNKF